MIQLFLIKCFFILIYCSNSSASIDISNLEKWTNQNIQFTKDNLYLLAVGSTKFEFSLNRKDTASKNLTIFQTDATTLPHICQIYDNNNSNYLKCISSGSSNNPSYICNCSNDIVDGLEPGLKYNLTFVIDSDNKFDFQITMAGNSETNAKIDYTAIRSEQNYINEPLSTLNIDSTVKSDVAPSTCQFCILENNNKLFDINSCKYVMDRQNGNLKKEHCQNETIQKLHGDNQNSNILLFDNFGELIDDDSYRKTKIEFVIIQRANTFVNYAIKGSQIDDLIDDHHEQVCSFYMKNGTRLKCEDGGDISYSCGCRTGKIVNLKPDSNFYVNMHLNGLLKASNIKIDMKQNYSLVNSCIGINSYKYETNIKDYLSNTDNSIENMNCYSCLLSPSEVGLQCCNGNRNIVNSELCYSGFFENLTNNQQYTLNICNDNDDTELLLAKNISIASLPYDFSFEINNNYINYRIYYSYNFYPNGCKYAIKDNPNIVISCKSLEICLCDRGTLVLSQYPTEYTLQIKDFNGNLLVSYFVNNTIDQPTTITFTLSPTLTPSNNNNDKNINGSKIAGIVFGVLILLTFFGILVYFIYNRKRLIRIFYYQKFDIEVPDFDNQNNTLQPITD